MSVVLSESTRGGVTCLLCNATISVKIGNYGKLKLHMETNHDVFYEQDLLVALNFLQDHEREVIIEKVLPRMDFCLNQAKNIDKNMVQKKKRKIERRLFSETNEDSGSEDQDPDVTGVVEKTTGKDKINIEDLAEDEDDSESPVKKIRLEESSLIEESLEISLDESDEILMEGDSQKGAVQPQMLCKDDVECGLCHNIFKKKSMYNHKRRCELRDKIKKMGEHNQKDRKEAQSVENNISKGGSMLNDQEEDIVESKEQEVRNRDSNKCEPCNITYSSRSNLARHKRQRHHSS